MMFENDRIQDPWVRDREKATRLKNEIIALLKEGHFSISESRCLLRAVIEDLEDTLL